MFGVTSSRILTLGVLDVRGGETTSSRILTLEVCLGVKRWGDYLKQNPNTRGMSWWLVLPQAEP